MNSILKLHESNIPTLTDNEVLAITKLKTRIKNELKATHLFLFGSKARGDHTRDSDVDLMVITSLEYSKELRRNLSDIQFDIIMEVDAPLMCKLEGESDWNSFTYRALRDPILEEGIEIEL